MSTNDPFTPSIEMIPYGKNIYSRKAGTAFNTPYKFLAGGTVEGYPVNIMLKPHGGGSEITGLLYTTDGTAKAGIHYEPYSEPFQYAG